MDEGPNIEWLNIEHCRRLLTRETDPDRGDALSRQLAEQPAKLQEMGRNKRGG